MWQPRILAVALVAAIVLAQAGLPARHVSIPSVLVGDITPYVVRTGDTLATLAARFGVDTAAIAADNNLPPRARLEIARTLHIDNRHIIPAYVDAGALLLNLPQRTLFVGEPAGGVAAYPVAVGRADWQTPIKPFVVVAMEKNPTWDVPESIMEEARLKGRDQPRTVPPGPANPLGKHWIGLSLPGIGLHGTNAPSSIFRAVTHGCVRMHAGDIERVFSRVSVGTPGRIIYEPVLLDVERGRVYLEVHRDIYGRRPGAVPAIVRELAAARGIADLVDWPAVDRVAAARHGVARDVTRLPTGD
jgi:L,D-transpeptidase ErfK/SrfK